MRNEIGLWIDHRKAVIVTISDAGEEVKEISSDMEKHVRYSNDNSESGSAEDIRDRQYENHLNSFYDEVAAFLDKANTIQIFGPGEAKGELEKRLGAIGLSGHIVHVETADKMTDGQISAKVRAHLHKKRA